MIPRILAGKIIQWSREYPVITVTRPCQSGKSTLCKALFPDKPYVSLEESSLRLQATEDPRGFLARYPDGAILDEIQRVPELSSYIQTIVDSRDKPGKFILTGSQQFELIAGVSQSLAGRTDIARLLPLSYQELYSKSSAPDLATMLYTGFYPRIHDKKLDPSEAMSFYFSTYVERDLRQIPHVRDLGSFERFMHLLAGRNGQILCFFEAYVIAEFFKSLYNRGKPDTLLYFRDQKGHEVDLISETQPETLLCEIKSSATFHPDFLAGMNYVEALLAQPVKKRLIMGSLDEPYWFKDTHVLGYSRAGDVE